MISFCDRAAQQRYMSYNVTAIVTIFKYLLVVEFLPVLIVSYWYIAHPYPFHFSRNQGYICNLKCLHLAIQFFVSAVEKNIKKVFFFRYCLVARKIILYTVMGYKIINRYDLKTVLISKCSHLYVVKSWVRSDTTVHYPLNVHLGRICSFVWVEKTAY